jgi:Domain of unknown function (DUF5753)
VRMGRRDALSDSRSKHLHALIGEAALREPVAARDVMIEQLRYLHMMSGLPTVTMQVMRSGSGWHSGLHGPFVFYDFPDSEPVVYFEHYSSGAFIQEEKDVTAYRYVIKEISRAAIGPEESSRFVAQVISEMEQTL